KDISKQKLEKLDKQAYTGSAIEPKVKFTGLTEGKDFEIVGYQNNIQKGTGRILVRGIGECSGLRIVTFAIAAGDVKTSWQGAWNGEGFVTK
ncbi:MAG: hypothetical protein IJT16_05800, partial [Lachnospiraceae bacterium]|nr:hypothetical protein [Lachnospiraceae bacterium]